MTTTRDPAPAEAPREGLPPCMRVARFDERAATFHDNSCGQSLFPAARFIVSWGVPAEWGKDVWGVHSDLAPLPVRGRFTKNETDDPTQAEAAWERAEHFVRTGELP